MIQVNELMLKNIVLVNDILGYVSWIQEGSISVTFFKRQPNLSNGVIANCQRINPIPLTEEWLLKFGFESNPYQDRYENKAIHVECNKLKGYTELWIERMPHIKYVHQLQNLYFALTGEELTIKND